MTEKTEHRRIIGAQSADRLRTAGAEGCPLIAVSCHRRLRGPYTGVDTVLRALLPDADRRWPKLVEQHRVELLYGMPELEEIIGPGPQTLAMQAPFKERTRFFGSALIRCMSHGIVTFLLSYADRMRQDGQSLPDLVFDDVHEADPTAQEFIALLVRRADPRSLRIVVCAASGELEPELAAVLQQHTLPLPCETGLPQQTPGSTAELVAAYVENDCTSDDPRTLSAYQQADAHVLQKLHDHRADQLEQGADWSLRIGALLYHREHGSDRAAARTALLEALKHCVETGFSAAVIDLGERGRAVTDPAEQSYFWEFTQQAAAACVSIGRLDDSLALYQDLLQRYTDPKVHMMTSYGIAMLHTRFLVPRDHAQALRWQHTAVAIANILPDPADRLTFSVFHDNGLALIEMHRGELVHALELVEGGIARLNAAMDSDQWQLHRSQLLYNRARLLAAMGRPDEAFADFTTLIELDPYYTDYLSERARISRNREDFDAALADYDRAVELAPPFPELFYNRGTARAEAGDVPGALEDFGYVLDMEPDDLDTRLARAELLLETGDLPGAEADVLTGLSLRPDEPRLLCLKGTVLLQRGLPADAFDSLSAALERDLRYPAALINRAVAAFELHRLPIAVEDLTATLEIIGEDPDVLLNRGLVYEAQGRADLALADFDRALELPEADLDELHRLRDQLRA